MAWGHAPGPCDFRLPWPPGWRAAEAPRLADDDGLGPGFPVADGVTLARPAVLPGVGEDVTPGAGWAEWRELCCLVDWDRSLACLVPPPSAPFTVQVTSPSMQMPAASAITLRRQ